MVKDVVNDIVNHVENNPKSEVRYGRTLAQHRQKCCGKSVANIVPLLESYTEKNV